MGSIDCHIGDIWLCRSIALDLDLADLTPFVNRVPRHPPMQVPRRSQLDMDVLQQPGVLIYNATAVFCIGLRGV